MGGAIEAGKAFVKFLLDDKEFNSGLASIGKKLTRFGSIGLAATLPIVLGFGAAAATFASVGGALDDMHRRTGLSVESLSELSFAAQQTGTDMGVVEAAMKALQKKGIDPLKFDEIAADIAAIPDHTARAKKAIEVFTARAGVALLPMLEDLPQLREEFRRLGLVMSTEDAQAADALGDAWDASKAQMTALVVQIGAAVAGPLTEFLRWSQAIVASTIQWVHENPRLVRRIAAITAAIAAVSAAAIVFGTILTIITLHPIVAALALIAAAIVGIATYFGLASSGAGDFKRQLDTVKAPSTSQNAAINRQASGLQSQLRAASTGQAVAASAVSPAAAAGANRAAGDFARQTAAHTLETVQVLKEILAQLRLGGGGLLMGAG